MTATAARHSRIDWVDYAKGICIILVVMMHSTLGVEKAAGELSWLNGFIEWARPFRMPDFFLISGLFLGARIAKPWRTYLDSKVLHFAYFYILWMTIQFAMKSGPIIADGGMLGALEAYGMGFVQPYGTLWFIYLLAVFFVVTKLLHRVPAGLIFAVAGLLEIAPINTGWLTVDEFASRYVYFYAGFWMARHVFDFAAGMNRLSTPALFSALVVWGFANALFVNQGISTFPVVSLILGFIGAGAVISSGVLLTRTRFAAAIRYCGENSIVIYLAFFVFMAASRSFFLNHVPGHDLALVSLAVTAAGVIGPILLFWAVRNTKAAFLFRRPAWARLAAASETRPALAARISRTLA
ncbi:acyltransferase family protein [soil metagenome]